MLHKRDVSRAAALLIILMLALSTVVPVLAQTNATIVNASRVNLRSGPGAGYPVVTVLSRGQQVILLNTNADASWFQLQTTHGLTGWVNSRYVAGNFPGIQVPVTAQTTASNAVVTTPRLNVRNGPGANFTDLGTLSRGDGLNLIGRNADSTWVQVNIPGGIQGGWVSARYIASSVPVSWLPLVSNTGVTPAFPDPVPPLGGQTGIVTAPRLNVRYGPGLRHNPFTILSGGEGVSLIARDPSAAWLLVQLADGRTGWVSSGFIRTTFPIHGLEVRG